MINYKVSQDEEVINVKLGQFSVVTVQDYDTLTNLPKVNGKTIEGNMTSEDFGVISNYEELSNLPSIDGVVLKGELSSSDLSIPHDYVDLENKPTLNGVEINGDMTSSDLGVVTSYSELSGKPSIDGVTIEGDMVYSDLGIPHSYDELNDRPSLDGVTLTGAMTSAQIGIPQAYADLDDKPTLDGVTIEGDMVYSDLGIPHSYDDLSGLPTVDGVTITGDMQSSDLGVIKSYNDLTNKPKINNVTLSGNVAPDQLGVVLSDTYANWASQTNLVSKKNVIYIYLDYQSFTVNGVTYAYPGIKVGNGYTKLNQLPFMNSPDPRLLNHIANNVIHITAEERNKWNQAISDIIVIQQSISGGMHSIGVTTTALTDGGTTSPILIGGAYVVPKEGDVVTSGVKEFMYTKGGYWVELGDNSVVYSLLDSNGKIDEDVLPAKSYDASSGTLTL